MEREMEPRLKINLKIFKKYLWVLLLVPVLCTTTAFLYAKYVITPEYEATTILILGKDYSEENYIQSNDGQVAGQLINTCTQIMRQKVTENLINTYDLATINHKVNVTPIENTQLIQMQIIDSDPQKAANMTNRLAASAINDISQLIPTHFIKPLAIAKVPSAPFRPNIKVYITAALTTGLALAVGIILFLILLNKKLYSSEDVTNRLNLPALGIIPTLKE